MINHFFTAPQLKEINIKIIIELRSIFCDNLSVNVARYIYINIDI